MGQNPIIQVQLKPNKIHVPERLQMINVELHNLVQSSCWTKTYSNLHMQSHTTAHPIPPKTFSADSGGKIYKYTEAHCKY